MAFLSSNPALLRALTARNYLDATPVQTAVLEDDAAHRDLLVSAQTGSGKTVAYGLALGTTLLGDAERLPPAGAPLALVIAPTRELALQVQTELMWLYAEAGARVVSCVGGMDPRREQRQLAEGAHIVVGTPGRLRDHLERGRLDFAELKAVVLDEADEMLDLGFREDLEFILQATPEDRRTLLFSATLPKAIIGLARTFQRHALRIEVGTRDGGHADIEYRATRILPREVAPAVVNTLRLFEAPTALVFCNTREAVRQLQTLLLERGFSVVALSGELSQSERNHALQALRDGRARVCVATDVAARGIDLPHLGLVIHADLPNDAETLQHRSGRTGRAGRKGVSVLLVPPTRRRRTEQMLAGAGILALWGGPPAAEEIRALDQERLLADPVFAEPADDDERASAEALVARHPAAAIAAAFVRLHGQRLPAPEDVTDPGSGPAREARDVRRPDRERGAPPAPRRGDMVGPWFRVSVGRKDNADPKWLLPMLCRRGSITRQDVGAIRIFERETKVQVRDEAAAGFARAVRRGEDSGVRIEPLAEALHERPAARPKPKRAHH